MFLGNSDEIYETFFGNFDPMAADFELDGSDVYGSFLNDAFKGKNQPKHQPPKDVEIEAKCTLAEFYNGSLKSLKYERDEIFVDERTVRKVEELVQFEVKPGYQDGTVLVFKSRGNEQYSNPRSDLKVKLIQEKEEKSNFERKGDDLVYTHAVTLE